MRETERRTDMTTHIVETDAEKAARAAAKVAYENIQKARHALYVAHRDCCAPVPIPVVGGDYVTPSNRRDLARLLNGTILHTPNGLYVKHWKGWRKSPTRKCGNAFSALTQTGHSTATFF